VTAAANAVEDPAAEVERLRAKVRSLEDQLADAIEERDAAQQEANRMEVELERSVEISRDHKTSLSHARSVIEAREAQDSFAQIMDVRAVDAITDLLRDR
jgi:outer membrane murein-binding lipoprotein Lpp